MRNVGLADRFLRVSLAIIIVYLFMNNTLIGYLGYVALFIAGVLFLTGLLGMCPLYRLLRISSNRDHTS